MLKNIFPILDWLPNYQQSDFKGDFFAGITVGVMLIPQGMAYAMIAGLPPVYGLYASIVPQLIYALLGTSRQLSVAPVAMDSLMVAAGVSVLATEGTEAYIGFAILLSFFMGLFQMLLGTARMGFVTNLLSKPVISGFTSAAAMIIGLNQLKYLLGIDIAKSNKVYQIIWNALQVINETHLITFAIGVVGIVLIKTSKKMHQNMPGALLAVVFGVVVVSGLNLDQEGVGIVKEIPNSLPTFKLPNFALGNFGKLLPLAFTISIVAFMEAYSVSKAIEAKRRDYKVIANQELIALGAANFIGSLFQTFPVSGGFSRSAVNYQAGANTPLASVISAVLVGLTLVFLTPLFYYLPLAILAAVILVAVASLVDVKYAAQLYRTSKLEFALLLATFLVTLNFSMVPGIVTGVILALAIMIYRTAYPHIAILGKFKEFDEFRNVNRFEDLETFPGILILRIDASLSFINIQNFRAFIETQVEQADNSIKTIILDAAAIAFVDASASDGLSDILDYLDDKDITLVFADLIGPVRDVLHSTGLVQRIKEENVFLSLHEAVKATVDDGRDRGHKYALQSNIDLAAK